MEHNKRMPPPILVVSLNPCVDRILYVPAPVLGTLNRAEKCVVSAGGKGVNVAKVLAGLGEQVILVGFFAGTAGDYIERELCTCGVDIKKTSIQGETRTTTNVIAQDFRQETEWTEPGPVITDLALQRMIETYISQLSKVDVLVISGSLPLGLPVDLYRTMIEQAKNKGKTVIFDASGEPLQHGLKALPDMIKPNRRELASICGQQENRVALDPQKYCQSLHERGVRYVCVSLGKKGALLSTKNEAVSMKALDVPVVHTIGCGDAMCAGLAYAKNREWSIQEMLVMGSACAASNATFEQIGRIDPQQVESLRENAKCTVL